MASEEPAKNSAVHERSVLIVGPGDSGKSTIINHILKREAPEEISTIEETSSTDPFQPSQSVPFPVDVESADGLVEYGGERYQFTTMECRDFFGRDLDQLEDIKRETLVHIDTVHLIACVVRYGCNKSDLKLEQYFTLDTAGPITALIITGCESIDNKKRRQIAEETKELVSPNYPLGKGIITVGFPCLRRLHPQIQTFTKITMKKDEKTLHELISQCKDPVPIKEVWKVPKADSPLDSPRPAAEQCPLPTPRRYPKREHWSPERLGFEKRRKV